MFEKRKSFVGIHGGSVMLKLISYAVLAPSGHNTQPWKFRIRDDSIEILPDYGRELTVVDPDHREIFISLGCAVENLIISAQATGLSPTLEMAVDDPGHERIRVRLNDTTDSTSRPNDGALETMMRRQTNRSVYTGDPIPEEDISELNDINGETGVQPNIVRGGSQTDKLIHLIEEGIARQMDSSAFKEELVSWMRFNRRDAEKNRDGLTYEAVGFPPVPFVFAGKLILKFMLSADRQIEAESDKLRSASAFLVISSESDGKRDWINVGRFFERFSLTATRLGIAISHYNQPIEVENLRGRLGDLNFIDGGYPALLVRLGYADPMPASPRRAVEDVLIS